jgi:transposase
MKHYKIISIDLAKNKFHLAALNSDNKLCLKKAVRREDLLAYIIKTFPQDSTLAMEACGSCHFWGNTLVAAGFKVILLKTQDVKPYAKSRQKNDANDALAICKAALDPELKHVHLKSIAQQAIAYLHKARNNIIQQRIQRSNSILSSLLEFGVVIKCPKAAFAKQADIHVRQTFQNPCVPENVCEQMMMDAVEIKNLLQREALLDKQISQGNAQSDIAKILLTIPGIGPVNASILSIQPMNTYTCGREFSASLGLVPSQHTTGGVIKLAGITKQGNRYIRTMLIQGARAIMMRTYKGSVPQNSLYDFALKLKATKGFNVACVAIANKLARIVHACATTKQAYS